MTPGATRCSSRRPGSRPRRVSARAGRPLRTKRSIRSTRAIARSIRSSGIDGGAAAPVAPAAMEPASSPGDERPGEAATSAGPGAARGNDGGSLRARTSVRSAARSSSVARLSRRAEAWSDAAVPSAMRRRAVASISTRAWPRNSEALDATRHASVGPAAPTVAPAGRRGAGDRRSGRGVRARSASAKRRRGGAGDCSLFGGCTRSGCMSDSRNKLRAAPVRSERHARDVPRSGPPSAAVHLGRACASTRTRSVRTSFRTDLPHRASADPGLERQADAIGCGAE